MARWPTVAAAAATSLGLCSCSTEAITNADTSRAWSIAPAFWDSLAISLGEETLLSYLIAVNDTLSRGHDDGTLAVLASAEQQHAVTQVIQTAETFEGEISGTPSLKNTVLMRSDFDSDFITIEFETCVDSSTVKFSHANAAGDTSESSGSRSSLFVVVSDGEGSFQVVETVPTRGSNRCANAP